MKPFANGGLSLRALPGVLALGMAFIFTAAHAQTNAPGGDLVMMTNTIPSIIFTNAPLITTNRPVVMFLTNLPPFSTNGLTNFYVFTNASYGMMTNWGGPYYPPPKPKPWWRRFWDWLW